MVAAAGCDAAALRNETTVREIMASIVADLSLKSVGEVWHKFPVEGGITALIALTESHLACHTYPEHLTATFNLYCCRHRPEWDWDTNLKAALKASTVFVTKVERGQCEISDHKFEIAGGER